MAKKQLICMPFLNCFLENHTHNSDHYKLFLRKQQLLHYIFVIEIKFVLGVQLSLVVPSPLHSLETLEKTEWAGVGIVPEVWGKVSRIRLPPPAQFSLKPW